MQTAEIQKRLLRWFTRHARKLPWRSAAARRDPYRVWVSEIMLQQTQVATVIPYYRRWLRLFPNVRSLAAAKPAAAPAKPAAKPAPAVATSQKAAKK